MSFLARKSGLCRSDIAHTAGLFCNIGIPLLMEKIPGYEAQLIQSETDPPTLITLREEHLWHTNHASLGALLARTWGLPDEVVEAILLHHQYPVMSDRSTPEMVRNLIALSLLADHGIHLHQSQQPLAEWLLGGAEVMHYLGMSEHEAEDTFEEIHDLFDTVTE